MTHYHGQLFSFKKKRLLSDLYLIIISAMDSAREKKFIYNFSLMVSSHCYLRQKWIIQSFSVNTLTAMGVFFLFLCWYFQFGLANAFVKLIELRIVILRQIYFPFMRKTMNTWKRHKIPTTILTNVHPRALFRLMIPDIFLPIFTLVQQQQLVFLRRHK